jgi:hypothetical protein
MGSGISASAAAAAQQQQQQQLLPTKNTNHSRESVLCDAA